MISDIAVSLLLVFGTFFMVAGSIGLARMPDLYCRMHAASKCVTLGISGLLIAAIIHLGSTEVTLKAILAILFQFLTTPVSAHMIARAAYYHLKVGFRDNTFIQDWKDWPTP
jgi:multicomponent Na+:H+ antiporter subunit G